MLTLLCLLAQPSVAPDLRPEVLAFQLNEITQKIELPSLLKTDVPTKLSNRQWRTKDVEDRRIVEISAATIGVWRSNGRPYVLSWDTRFEDPPETPRSDEVLTREVNLVLDTIGFWGDRREVRVLRNPKHPRYRAVEVQAFIGDTMAGGPVLFDYQNQMLAYDQIASGYLETVRLGYWWKYDKYSALPRISSESARAIADEAYFATTPFPVTVLGKTSTTLQGVEPAMFQYADFQSNLGEMEQEVSQSEQAIPVYISEYMYVHPKGKTARQWVYVNLITGRPFGLINNYGERGDGASPRGTPAPALEERESLSLRDQPSFLVTRKAEGDPTGKTVFLERGKYTLQARWDADSKTLWLPEGAKWSAYSVPEGVVEPLTAEANKERKSPFAPKSG